MKNTKLASALAKYDYVWSGGAIREVRHVEPFKRAGVDRVAVMFSGGTTDRWDAADEVHLATEQDIDEERAHRRRTETVDGLRALADLLADKVVPTQSVPMSFRVHLNSEAELREWATQLGVDVVDRPTVVGARWQYPPGAAWYEAAVEIDATASRDTKESVEGVGETHSTEGAAAAAGETSAAPAGPPADAGGPDQTAAEVGDASADAASRGALHRPATTAAAPATPDTPMGVAGVTPGRIPRPR